jgi:hypothetical protein
MVTKESTEQVTCDCGKVTVLKGVKGHLRSKQHMDWQKQEDVLADPNNSTKMPDIPLTNILGVDGEDAQRLQSQMDDHDHKPRATPDVSDEVRRVLNNPELLAQVLEESRPAPLPMLPEEEDILRRARNYEDPIDLAKGLRQIYNAQDWPNESHLETQIEWLIRHNIPIRTMPRHLDPDASRLYVNSWYQELREKGWGKHWEIK